MKTRKFFNVILGKQTAQEVCFMNDRQPNSQDYKDCSGGSVPKTRLLCPSTQQIRKYGRAILSISTMTKDCHDELGSQFLLHRDLYKFLTVRPVWFFFFLFFIISVFFFSVLFLDTKLHILDECLLCACNEKITLA